MKSTLPDEIHTHFSMLSACENYKVGIKCPLEKRKNPQKEILKPDAFYVFTRGAIRSVLWTSQSWTDTGFGQMVLGGCKL